MQLHTILLGVNDTIMQFCVFTGSGSPSDEWHHETDSKGNKVVRVEFEVSRMCGLEEFNEAIKNAEQVAVEEYHKHCALRGPMSVDLTGYTFDPEVFVPSQGAFTNKEGVTVPLNNAEVKVALGQYMPTAAENKAAEDFFKRHGVRPYEQSIAGKWLDAEAMQEVMAHDQEIDKAISKIAAAYPRAFGIVKQPLTPEQKADMDKYYEILAQQTKDAVSVIPNADNLSQLGSPKKPENATKASFRCDLALSADDHFLATGRLLADAKPQYGLLNTFLSEAEKAGITHLPIDQQKLPTSDPVALGDMIEKRTKMAEALRKQDVEFIGYGKDADGNKVARFKPIDNANIEALKQRARVAKRSYDAALDKKGDIGNLLIERDRCYNEFIKACTALRQAGVPVSDVL